MHVVHVARERQAINNCGKLQLLLAHCNYTHTSSYYCCVSSHCEPPVRASNLRYAIERFPGRCAQLTWKKLLVASLNISTLYQLMWSTHGMSLTIILCTNSSMNICQYLASACVGTMLYISIWRLPTPFHKVAGPGRFHCGARVQQFQNTGMEQYTSPPHIHDAVDDVGHREACQRPRSLHVQSSLQVIPSATSRGERQRSNNAQLLAMHFMCMSIAFAL